MNRRGFMGSILALGAAPAIVRADALMRVRPRNEVIFGRGLSDSIEGNWAAYSHIGSCIPPEHRIFMSQRLLEGWSIVRVWQVTGNYGLPGEGTA